MGKVLFGAALSKTADSLILISLIGLIMHLLLKVSSAGYETAAIAVFLAMCCSGYIILRAAQNAADAAIKQSQTACETAYDFEKIHCISPAAFNGRTVFPKYPARKAA